MIASRDNDYISPEDYLALEATSQVKHEYVDGEVFAMAGSSDDHSAIVFNVAAVLRGHLRGRSCRALADVKAKGFSECSVLLPRFDGDL
jgi:Uma2 family endonuclease